MTTEPFEMQAVPLALMAVPIAAAVGVCFLSARHGPRWGAICWAGFLLLLGAVQVSMFEPDPRTKGIAGQAYDRFDTWLGSGGLGLLGLWAILGAISVATGPWLKRTRGRPARDV